MRITLQCAFAATIVGLMCLPAWAATPEQEALLKKLKPYPSRYYTIYSDLTDKQVAEASARLNSLGAEYHRRTAGFAGNIRDKLPFYLFSSKEDYLAAGGMKGSAGMFNGKALMACASSGGVWHIVQHEAFHQFAAAVITRKLPTWINEGMAEYFGEGLWTGDNLWTGVIPPARLERVQALIRDKKLTPFGDMIKMSGEEWANHIDIKNYDQAWSMVHFLIYGDNGKYQKAFVQCINDIAHGVPVATVFANRLGADMQAFQKQYEQWWLSLGDNPTADVYAQAYVGLMTSTLARGHVSGQKYKDFEDFLAVVKDGKLTDHTKQHMPPELIEKGLRKVPVLGEWTLEYIHKKPQLVLVQEDKTKFVGTLESLPNEVVSVSVTVIRPKAPTTGSTTKTATGRTPTAAAKLTPKPVWNQGPGLPDGSASGPKTKTFTSDD